MSVIDIHEMEIIHNCMYGINYKYSILCKINLITNEVKDVQSLIIDGEKLQYAYPTEFYRHIVATETSIFIINTNTKELLIFNNDLKLVQKLYLMEKAEYMNIIGISKNNICIYAIDSGMIIEVNLENWKIKKYQVPQKYIGKINSMEIKIIDNSFWLTGYMGNIILEIDIESGRVHEHEIGSINGDICLCQKFENNLWLCTQYEIVEWDKKKNIIMQVFQLPLKKGRKDSLMPFYYSCVANDNLWLFPLKEDKLLRIGENIEPYYIQKNTKQLKRQKKISYLGKNEITAIIYGLDSNMNNILLNTETGKTKKINFLIDEALFEKVKTNFAKYNFLLDERMFSISELLNSNHKANLPKKCDNVGHKIYNLC